MKDKSGGANHGLYNGFPFEIKRPADTPYTPMSEEEILTKLKKSREQGKFTDADDVISGMFCLAPPTPWMPG